MVRQTIYHFILAEYDTGDGTLLLTQLGNFTAYCDRFYREFQIALPVFTIGYYVAKKWDTTNGFMFQIL